MIAQLLQRHDALFEHALVKLLDVEARTERRWKASVTAIRPDNDTFVDPDVARSVAARDELEIAFRALTPVRRAVVVLHHHLGYPLTEIAATLGIPVGTARSRLHFATRQLRAAIEADARPMSSEERTA